MADSDDHIIRLIGRGGKLTQLFVGIYGDPESPGNQLIRRKAAWLQGMRTGKQKRLEVDYFDAQSAHVWG
jgi:hypothetical protein